MNPSPTSVFELFLAKRSNDLERIARCSKGRHELGDVKSQSWLIARELSADDTLAELQREDFQEEVLRRLYNSLVNKGKYILRKTIRLDTGGDDEDEPSGVHPLMRILSSADPDPLEELVDREELAASVQAEDAIDVKCSLAGAYACLLSHFGKSWRNVSKHLNISAPTARNHYRRAEFVACLQHSLPSPMPAGFMPGPWHPPRSERKFRQLGFEFAYQLVFQQGEEWKVPRSTSDCSTSADTCGLGG